MDEMARAADVGVRKSLKGSFAKGLADVFKVSAIKMFLGFVR